MSFLLRKSKRNLVQQINILSDSNDHTKGKVETDSDSTEFNLNLLEDRSSRDVYSLTTLLEKTNVKLESLRKENERLESIRIVLEDKATYFEKMCNEKEAEILTLIAEIEILKAQNNELISHRDDGASKARKQHISNFEGTLSKANEDYRKKEKILLNKISRLQEKYAKSKQDHALKVFALKDENCKLMVENSKLKECFDQERADGMNRPEKSSVSSDRYPDDTPNSPRNELILHLSQQVSSLDCENRQLRQELEQLKGPLKEGTARNTSRTNHQQLHVFKLAGLDGLNSSKSRRQMII
ncbi:uncharacterized protein LOC124433458 [Xenia sp. Carnegie-2017]|uniref:uncharacterized protein LOC124433458 n=1 Tax=Xenia sp. Carnegie-2017 TaxID=2897299 RepID=UPI001F046925|nr:uncharacterized protein LOC124433458 [Xenia sp. Carnegie-2017]